MTIIDTLAKELGIRKDQVEKTIALIDEGNTIPFIARYRKEVTGDLSDTILRDLETRLNYLRNLEERKLEIERLIDELGELTEELTKKIRSAKTLQALEDIYRPFRPKRRTRATMAKEKGLEPLADYLLSLEAKPGDSLKEAEKYLSEEHEVLTPQDALQGAMDIIAEIVSDDAGYRDIVRHDMFQKTTLVVTGDPNAQDRTYEMYQDFEEPVRLLKPHRILALFRGEKEGVLKLNFAANHDVNADKILRQMITDKNHDSYPYLEEAVLDGYKRLLFPSVETEVRSVLKEMADSESIKVFAGNLEPYLMQAPLTGHVIMGIDPGYRTGCKVAVISKLGEFLESTTIFPTKPHQRIRESKETLKQLIKKHGVSVISIGNGTGSRETEQVVAQLLEEMAPEQIFYTITNESGASIYSASKLAEDEFPQLDVTIRGAISIARRLQDPLAELVKIEPKHIGVGQYQHDVNQKQLSQTLENVVEDCVNRVGVDINRASPALLAYVSGLSKTVARNIISHKESHGAFTDRKAILKVKGLGPKAFEQSAGFLRVPESRNPLDNTGVHPESYPIAERLIGQPLDMLNLEKVAKELNVGLPTLTDIVNELKKPGRDPREDMPKPILRSDVLSIEDLEVGMELTGTVRNVVDFGAFVDIGIKNDGLVHVSEISNRFIKHPSDVLKVADIVKVRIIRIDHERGQVGLSMKGLN